MIRTYIMVAIPIGVFRADSLRQGLSMYKNVLYSKPNPWILFNINSWMTFGGLPIGDWILIVFGITFLLATAMIRLSTGKTTRAWLSEQNLLFRWMVWIVLFFIIVIWGKYGPDYDVADFIYKGF